MAHGFASKTGVGKETTWGTLVDPVELIPFKPPESITEEAEYVEDETIIGKAGRYPGVITARKTAGEINCELSYQDTDILLAAALGGGASTPTGTGPYTHIIDLAEDINRSLSVHIEKEVSVHSFGGTKINSMTIRGAGGEKIEFSLSVIAKKPTRGTTYRTELDSLSLPSKPRVKFSHLTFLLGDLANALSSSDEKKISEFELVLNNNLKADDFTSASGEYIEEPLRAGRREVSLRIVIPRYASDEFLDWFSNETKLQAKLEFTYGNYQFIIELPTIRVKNTTANVPGPDFIPCEVEMTAYRNDGNTNMNINEEMRITIVNDRSTAIWS
jgi:hypothetical protein